MAAGPALVRFGAVVTAAGMVLGLILVGLFAEGRHRSRVQRSATATAGAARPTD